MRKFLFFGLLGLIGLSFTSCEEQFGEGDVTETTYAIIDFDDVVLDGDTILNDTNFVSRGVTFNNNFTDYGAYTVWSGFACSAKTDTVTAGFTNDLSVFNSNAASGYQFAVFSYLSWDPLAYCVFPDSTEYEVKELKVNNGTYAYLSMRDGDAYAKQFVAGDWFKLSVYGYDTLGVVKDSVEYYLADFRAGKSYLCKDWTVVNLESLGAVHKLSFGFSSSDTGPYGMNTPAYVCIDDIVYKLKDE